MYRLELTTVAPCVGNRWLGAKKFCVEIRAPGERLGADSFPVTSNMRLGFDRSAEGETLRLPGDAADLLTSAVTRATAKDILMVVGVQR